MYPQRISQSIVSSQPNLKKIILVNKHRYYFTKYSLMIRQKFNGLKTFKDVNRKLHDMIKNGKFIELFKQCPGSKGSNNVLKVWIHHCECVFAQRLRRCQQMFCLYSKWWEEQALKECVQKMRQTLTKKGREFALGAVGISAYDWKENRISDETVKEHSKEIEYIYILKDNTVCLACDSTNKNNSPSDSNSAICKCGVSVWRRLHPSGQFEYKVYGSYHDVSAEDFLNVQIDTNYRRKWDATAVVLEVAETDPTPNSNSDIIYWEMDYVFNRRYLVDRDDKLIYILSKSTEHPGFPKYPEKYRIEDYWSCMVIKPYTEMNQPGIEFSLSYFDNPGVNIPSSVTTWVSMRAMPDFLERLRDATKKYRDYCIKEGISKACKIISEEERTKEEQLEKEKLEYCTYIKPNENAKLKALYSSIGVERETRKSEKYILNYSDPNREVDNNSDVNSTSPSAVVQPENNNFWKVAYN
ncbi:hypothetical protein NQ318_007831 [Aromia moschata]|uniref:Phosphatidylcholine transfer protein n=1 Tax=Aromia moschata TaxID=1265417 RepID=A0AAV8Z036_9CUCU|nr:hypothetical protein NQ318_007831 [Aromia moschata]